MALKNGASPLFLFNGEALPTNPSVGYLEENEQLVKDARSASGKVVAQTVNRRLNKFSSLSFPILSLEDYVWLKKKVANFKVNLTYYDTEENGVVTRFFYFGNLSGTPYKWDKTYKPVMKPTDYKDVKVNIIDMGYD